MTTVLSVRRDNQVVMAADGQVTFESYVVKSSAKKLRRMYKGQVLCGFAGAAADGLALFERLEKKLEEYNGNLLRASVELAREWRTDKVLRRLEAMLLVADKNHTLILSGNGDVLEPDDGIAAIGSGGPYAVAAARALYEFTDMKAVDIAKEAMRIAADICIYTNHNISLEVLEF